MTCCTVNKFVSVRLFFALYVVDAHQDFYMRIAMRISAYADHPHEPHGSATAWPTLIEIQISVGEVIDPSWRGDVAKVTSIEIQISVGSMTSVA